MKTNYWYIKLYMVCVLFTIIATSSCFAQLKSAKVSQLSFMSGIWTQKTEWGDLEEFWSEPNGGSMINSFRCVKDGKPIFYEFVVIEQDGDLPVMKMRHFNTGNIGREEKEAPMTYQLTELTDRHASFTNKDGSVILSYDLQSKNKLNVIVEEKDQSGHTKQEIFNFTRKHKNGSV